MKFLEVQFFWLSWNMTDTPFVTIGISFTFEITVHDVYS